MRYAVVLMLLASPVWGGPVTVGANTHLPPRDTLDLSVDLGIEWIRIDVNWNIAEATEGSYDWSVFDAVIDGANARGLKVFATIGYGPAWASVSGDSDGRGAWNDVPDADEFRDFVTAAAARYSDGRVAAWGTWNEPNLGFLEGTIDQWIDNVVDPTIDGVQAGCPTCLIVGPELASIGEDYEAYLRAFLEARGDDVDVLSWHIYSPFPEDDLQAGITKDSFYNDLDAHRLIEIAGIVIYEGPMTVREVALEMGYDDLPIWIAETGEHGGVGDATELAAQRTFVERVVTAQEERPWWTVTMFYELVQEGDDPSNSWGLAYRTSPVDDSFADNFGLKPAYEWLRDYLATPSDPDAGPIDPPADAAPPPTADAAPSADAQPPPPPPSPDAGNPAAGDETADTGCGCRTSPGDDGPSALLLLVAAGAILRRRATMRG